ncbi:MAG: hypothetical protein FJ190_00010 [Gammaproteobacteria bacterium]|nr:hypothetical protein [Gammaproteobacteria bacterium]
MNLNVPDLRKKLRRTNDISLSGKIKIKRERRKLRDRRVMKTEQVKSKKIKKIWLTPHTKNLINDLFFLDIH